MDPADLSRRARARTLLLDTNLLLVVVPGGFDRRLVGRGRLDQFTLEHVDYLRDLFASARGRLATPHVLTEVSNLAMSETPKAAHPYLLREFAAVLGTMAERFTTAAALSGSPVYAGLGLTDAAIADATDVLVVSIDRRLCGALLDLGTETVNFNHVRF